MGSLIAIALISLIQLGVPVGLALLRLGVVLSKGHVGYFKDV